MASASRFKAARLRTAAAALVFTIAPVVHAQTITAPGFEVASVRRNTSSAASSAGARPDGFTAINVTLRDLLLAAYSLPKSRILGGPDWVDSDRYDVSAKGGRSNNPQANLQALLLERFALVVRRERRD